MNIKLLTTTIITLLLSLLLNTPANAIKIGLKTGVGSYTIASSSPGSLIDGSTNRNIMSVAGMQPLSVQTGSNGISININKRNYNLATNFLILRPTSGFVYAKNRWYRGQIIVYNLGSSLNIINDLSLEEYLLGVVPSEMPRSWNIEAHKAQAIAARSYAVANLGKRRRQGFDLKDTPEDQAYGGATAESYRTNLAVIQTSGQVLVYGNKVIPAYYCASAGGYTVNSGDVWVKNLPYLHSVPSFDNNIKKNGHGIGMSQHGANKLANYGYNAYQILGYFYQNVKLYKINTRL